MKRSTTFALIFLFVSMGLVAQVCTDTDALGSSSNVFTLGHPNNNAVAVDNDINTVVFIHRNNAGLFGGHSGQLRYDISTDNGVNWTSDLGVINPASVNGTNGARYPNVALYNPTGNTNPDNAYLSYYSASVAATWGPHVSGVRKLDGTGNTENYNQVSTTQNLIPRSLCKGGNGTFWAIDAINNGTSNTGYRILKGTWNGSDDVNWTLNTTLNPAFNLNYSGVSQTSDFAIGFDPSGQKGWVCIITDVTVGTSDYSFHPVFYSTVDGGLTWSGSDQIDLTQFPCITSFITAGNVPTVAFEMDLTVDGYGNPHAVLCVGSNPNAYSIYYGDAHHMFDITQEYGVWNAIDLGSVNAGRNTFGVAPNQLFMDMNPQASRTDDGTKVFFTWAGSDALPVLNAPNLYGRSYDVMTKTWTNMFDLSTCNVNTSGNVLFPKMAESVLEVAGGWELPIVYGVLSNPNDLLQPATFSYMDSLKFEPADYSTPQCSANIVFSNPDTVMLCEGGAGTMDISSTHDQILWDNGATTASVAIINAGWNYVTVRNACCLGRDSLFVIIDSLPVSVFNTSANDLSVNCTDGSTGAPESWLWDFGDGNSSTAQNPSHTYAAAGTYTVCLTVSDACGSDSSCQTIVVSCPIPTPDFNSTIGNGGLVSFTNTTSPLASGYYWDFGDGNTSTLENPNHTYTTSGTYTVCLFVQDNCGTDSICESITVDVFAALDEIVGNTIHVYPNPADHVLHIQGEGLQGQSRTLRLVNGLGEVFWTGTVEGNTIDLAIPIENLAASTYFLEIRSETQATHYKVMIQ